MRSIRFLVEGLPDQLFFNTLFENQLHAFFPEITFNVDDSFVKSKLLNLGIIQSHFASIKNNEEEACFIIPDLFPQDACFPHKTRQDLQNQVFNHLRRLNPLREIDHYLQRLKVHVFKHCFEVILIAEIEKLFDYLQVDPVIRVELCQGLNLSNIEEIGTGQAISVEKTFIKRVFKSVHRRYTSRDLAPVFKTLSVKTLTAKLPHFKAILEDLVPYATANFTQRFFMT